jgi:hypothetical protein
MFKLLREVRRSPSHNFSPRDLTHLRALSAIVANLEPPLSGMASTRITAPIRGVTAQLSRFSIRQDATPVSRPLVSSHPTTGSLTCYTEMHHNVLRPSDIHLEFLSHFGSPIPNKHLLQCASQPRQASGTRNRPRNHPPLPLPRIPPLRTIPSKPPLPPHTARHPPSCHCLRG